MFEPFSSAYYLGRLYVEPSDGERPVMQRDLHEQVNEQLYATGTGIERLDNPLIVKLGTSHLAVHGDAGVPDQTIVVPEVLLDERIRDPPDLREVLLAKADRAAQLVRIGAPVGV